MMAAATIAAAATLAPSFRKNWRPPNAAVPAAPAPDTPGALAEYNANPVSSPGESKAGMVGASMAVSDVMA